MSIEHLQTFFFGSLSLCHDTCTSTQEDVGSGEEEFMKEEEEEPEKNAVSYFVSSWSVSGARTP